MINLEEALALLKVEALEALVARRLVAEHAQVRLAGAVVRRAEALAVLRVARALVLLLHALDQALVAAGSGRARHQRRMAGVVGVDVDHVELFLGVVTVVGDRKGVGGRQRVSGALEQNVAQRQANGVVRFRGSGGDSSGRHGEQGAVAAEERCQCGEEGDAGELHDSWMKRRTVTCKRRFACLKDFRNSGDRAEEAAENGH